MRITSDTKLNAPPLLSSHTHMHEYAIYRRRKVTFDTPQNITCKRTVHICATICNVIENLDLPD